MGELPRLREMDAILRDLEPTLDGAIVDEQLDGGQFQRAPDGALVIPHEVLADISLGHRGCNSLPEP